MDLSTTYLGLRLSHPLMPGASPLVDDLSTVRRLEDAGAAAIVMHSLFEEQIVGEQLSSHDLTGAHAGSHFEAASYFPSPEAYALGPGEYLAQIERIKKAVRVPVIASLNGTTRGGWLEYARLMEQAGADALELNVYSVAADPHDPPQMIERRIQEMVRAVKSTVRIPLAVKLSPFFTSLPYLAEQLVSGGAQGLVLFNRFYQPDIDTEQLEVTRSLHLSDSSELLLRLRWLAILSGRVNASLGASGGVHTGLDAIKAIMCGAHAVQLVSALLRKGVDHLRVVRQEMVRWMDEHEYASLAEMQGSMSLKRCPNPKAYERANYMHVLNSWRGEIRQSPLPNEETWFE
jgi:dihydroorotate dehydrogenase (fumarate)